LVLPVKKSRTTFSQIEVPYALKLLDQELTTYANASVRFLTEKHVRAFRDLPAGTGIFEQTPTPPPTDILSSVMATFAGTSATAAPEAPTEESLPTPTSTPISTATPMEPISKEQAAANAMFDFMPGGPPKLEVVQEEPTPTPTPTPNENTVGPLPSESEVKVVKVSAPTPNMAGPAEPVPTVISEAGDNPLIAEGAPLPVPNLDAMSVLAVKDTPSPDINDAVSVQAVKGEATPDAPAKPGVEIRPRRSSMKGGRAADAQTPSAEIPSDADVKVIKIDA